MNNKHVAINLSGSCPSAVPQQTPHRDGPQQTNLSKIIRLADAADTAYECWTLEQTMQHLLRCPLLENECSLEDLPTANEKALH